MTGGHEASEATETSRQVKNRSSCTEHTTTGGGPAERVVRRPSKVA